MLSTLSCSIKGSFQGLYSYQNTTVKIAPYLIQKPKTTICNLIQPDTPIVYAINGTELRHCIKPFEKALVYIWKPKCLGELCISPNDIQMFCQKNKLELFIVAQYYDYKTMSLKYELKRPLWGVDCNYYSTQLTEKYIQKFMKDLMQQEIIIKHNLFFLFHYGSLINMSENIRTLKL